MIKFIFRFIKVWKKVRCQEDYITIASIDLYTAEIEELKKQIEELKEELHKNAILLNERERIISTWIETNTK